MLDGSPDCSLKLSRRPATNDPARCAEQWPLSSTSHTSYSNEKFCGQNFSYRDLDVNVVAFEVDIAYPIYSYTAYVAS